jgi:hypothetical protein
MRLLDLLVARVMLALAAPFIAIVALAKGQWALGAQRNAPRGTL